MSIPGGGRQGARDAVFLDRDGTIIEEVGYLDRVERVAFYPWTIDAVRSRIYRARMRLRAALSSGVKVTT